MGLSKLVVGNKLRNNLEALKEKYKGAHVKVGFLSGATYPDGTKVAYIAAIQEFGTIINMPEREQDINFRINKKTGEIGNKFVKKKDADFTQTVTVGAHQIVIPPRPYFRFTIAEGRRLWPGMIEKCISASGGDIKKALGLFGTMVTDQLKKNIIDFSDPANAISTIKSKGFNDPLIDTGHMLNSVDYEVVE